MSEARPSTRLRSARRPRRPLRSHVLRALLGLGVVVGCEEVLIDPIPVATVQVVPDSAALFVGDSVQLEARLFDDIDEPVGGRPVTWTSNDPELAAVDAGGLVVGVGAGTTQVRATAEGQSGSASIVILRHPQIALDRSSVAFSAVEGSSDPPPVAVAITNAGDSTLANLSVVVIYDDGVGPWLEAALDTTVAPAVLTLTARTGVLEPAGYAAAVEVSDPAAINSPVTVDAVFQVQQSVPVAPSGLEVTGVAASSIELAWSDNSDNEAELRVERQADGEAAFSPLTTLGAGSMSYVDNSVNQDRRYGYRVRACNGAGCSPYSNQATATTSPFAPSGLTAQAASASQVDLSWVDNSATETEIRVERRVVGGSFTRTATLGPNVTTHRDTTVQPETDYEYRLQACNDDGCSTFSGTAAVTTPPVPIPGAPTSLTAATVSRTRIDLAWTDNSAEETGFEVERRGPGENQFTLLAAVAADTVTYSDTTVAEDGTYVYRVRACGSGGCSEYSNNASATTPPSAPTNLTAVVVSASRIDLSWFESSATETSFQVERRVVGGSYTRIATPGADVTQFSDTGVTIDTEYEYRVRACNGSGCSDYSNEAA
ncbi:MAG: fibronectin type III domain-containing protein, partial [Longimicrobiales bacterium]|nr:fibronectin type III domain-containing protein [Longimicrobiales bacterium]